jgi:hypothetical protein
MARALIVAVVPHSPVSVDDVPAGLVLGRPHVGEALGFDIPAGQGFGKGTVEDLAEVPGFPGRQVLDQAQEVSPSSGQRAAGVVFGEPVDLGEHRLAYMFQVIVQICLREVIDHGIGACHSLLVGSTASADPNTSALLLWVGDACFEVGDPAVGEAVVPVPVAVAVAVHPRSPSAESVLWSVAVTATNDGGRPGMGSGRT